MASQSTQPPATNPVPQELTNNDLALLLNTQHSSAVEVIHRHSTALTNAIGNDFQYFSNKFVELGFVTRTAANDIPTIVGIGNMERGHQLLELVIDNCNISPDKKKWLEKFIAVFSCEPAYATLATSMAEDFSTSGGPTFYDTQLTTPLPVVRAESTLTTTHASPHHSTHIPPVQPHTSVSPAAYSSVPTEFLPHLSMQPNFPIPHPAYHPPMRPPQYLPHYPPHYPPYFYPLPGYYGIPPLTAHPLSVQPHASDRPSLAEWGTPYPLPHHTSLHQTSYSNSPRVPYHTMSLPTSRHSQQVEAVGTCRSSPSLISHSEPQLTHIQTHRPSGSSSLESGCAPATGPRLRTTLEPYNQSHAQSSSSDSRSSEKNMSPINTFNAQLQHISPFHSDQYFSFRDSPQSVRQSPSREHSQSQLGPQKPHLQAAVMSCPNFESTFSQYSSTVNTGIAPVVDWFIDHIKTIYKESEVEKRVKWPPTPSTVYINLACINRKTVSGKSREYTEITEAMVRDGNVDVINTTKGPIEFSEIAEGISITSGKHTGRERRVILVEGAPGVGKSTFAWEFCRRWERGEIAQQYQLVLLLRLRDDRISKAKSLKDLIQHPLEGVSQAVIEKLAVSHDFHALIILEGFDELPDHCRNDQSIFFQLIAGKLLPLATVLVTSRPWATKRIRWNYGNRIYQHIEILGFSSQQITEYIERTVPQDKVSDFKAYLEKHPQIRMGMYIPLNSAIVVTVYQESQESGCALPTTLTELYTAMAQTLLVRYLCGHPQYETTTLKTFNDLPLAVYTKFSEVCELAYRGIVGTSDDVQLIFTGLPSDFDSLGLMDSVTELYVTQGAVSSHNFLHLTFQEYFAAVHISTLSQAEQLEYFKRHKEGRLKVVLRFLAGLNKLSCFSKENVNHFLTPPQDKDKNRGRSPYSIPVDVGVTTDLVNWMFEVQSSDVITLALEKKRVDFSFARYMLPLDYYCLGYCIAHSQCQWVVLINKKDISIGIEEMRMLVAGVNTAQQPSGRIVGLRVWEYAYEVLNMLFMEWKSVLHLHELCLRLPVPCRSITWPDLSALPVLRLVISDKTNWRLDTLLPHHSLESLTIQGYSTSDGDSLVYEDCVAIADYITSVACLKELCFVPNDACLIAIDDKGLEAITKALADNQSLPLERLELDCKCTCTDNAAEYLAQFISNITTLQNLSIVCCTFSAHGLLELARAIHDNSTLQEKSLKELRCTVNGDDEAKDLAQLLVEYPQVEGMYEHDVMFSQISDAGAVALAQALHHISTLKRLNLSNNSISDAGAVALAQALHHNSTLYWLYLSNNSISDAGAVALAQALHHNSTLKRLNLSNNSISDAGAVALAQALHHNSTLYWLYLSNNSISDAGAVSLAQALHHNSTLYWLYLSNNSISDAGAVALAQALHHNSTLYWLYLSNNSISDAGTVALAQALHHNSTLEELDLYGNDGIGEEGTRQLVQALTVNTSIRDYCADFTGGLILPKRCEEYATQCTQYDTVKKRMDFR